MNEHRGREFSRAALTRRPFRGIGRQGPRETYDAIIAGAGVGGLVLANLLARAGLSVLLSEQHYVVGGFCSTFRRSGFVFDAATHFFPLLGNPETITGKLMRELGVRTDWIKMDPVDVFHLPDGTRFEVPAELDDYLRKLKAEFPAEAKNIDGFFVEVRKVYLQGLLQYFRWRESSLLDPYRHLTLGEALDRWFTDPRLKLVLTADSPHWGSAPTRVSYVFDSMLRLSYFQGNYFPRGGSQAFVDDLARTFEERGGDILLRARVHKITMAGDRVNGVEIDVGTPKRHHRVSVRAPIVISNGDLTSTMNDLLPESAVDPEYRATLASLRPTFPCFLTHLGIEEIPIADIERVQGYHWDSWDASRVGRDALRFKIFCPSLHDPDLAPPGKQIIIVQKVQEIDYSSISDWTLHKQGVEEFIFRELEKLLPGISQRVVVRSSASAFTSFRFTRNLEGAMLGWDMTPDQLGVRRPDVKGPVDGLYLVGHWTRPGGGITPVIVSAMRAAELILAPAGRPAVAVDTLSASRTQRGAE